MPPKRTLGGGRVLDPFAPARHRRSPERLAQLQTLATTNSLEEALPALLANSDTGLDPQRLERQFNRPPFRRTRNPCGSGRAREDGGTVNIDVA